jgi:hypothetical protein
VAKRVTSIAVRPPAPAPVPVPDNPALVFERLARDKNIDPDKLEKLINLQERIFQHQARERFDAAFALMQNELPSIGKKGQILNKDRTTVRSTYARLEDIHAVVKPILAKHGFSLRHRTEWPADKPKTIRIVGILTGYGHREESAFEAEADRNEFRTTIQDQGSTVSYGRRYTTKDLLNLTEIGVDNDGQAAPKKPIRRETHRAAPTSPAAEPTPTDPAIINQKQRQRLWVIIRKVGREEAEVKTWLQAVLGITSTKQIRRRDYDAVCQAVEKPGPLPMPREREPGEEG